MIVCDAWELLSFSSAFVVYIYRSRFMRQTDRKKNDMAFPKLYYPELYLLDGGYKAFYEKFPVSIITVLLPLVCDGITPNLAGCFFSALIIIITIDYHKHLPPFTPPPPLPLPSPPMSLLQELCEPNCYVQMHDDNHKEDLRHFKHRSKSWPCGDAATSKRRGSHLKPRRSTVDSHKTDTRPQKS